MYKLFSESILTFWVEPVILKHGALEKYFQIHCEMKVQKKYGSSVTVFDGVLYRALCAPLRICTDNLFSLRTPVSVHFLC